MPEPPLRSPVLATRRTTIAAAFVLALAGCRWGPDDTDPDDASQLEPEGDAKVVEAAVKAIRGALALVRIVQDEFVDLTIPLGPLANTHRAHLTLLGVEPVPDRGGGLTDDSRRELRRVRARETFLQGQLVDLALEAESGDLARALASMSAAVAQLLAVFPTLEEEPA